MFVRCLLLFVDALSVLSLGQVLGPRRWILGPRGALGRSWPLLDRSCALWVSFVRLWPLLDASWSILGWIFGRPGMIWEAIF